MSPKIILPPSPKQDLSPHQNSFPGSAWERADPRLRLVASGSFAAPRRQSLRSLRSQAEPGNERLGQFVEPAEEPFEAESAADNAHQPGHQQSVKVFIRRARKKRRLVLRLEQR